MTSDNYIILVRDTSAMTIDNNFLEMMMAKFRQSLEQSICNDEKLLYCNTLNDNILLLVCGTSERTLRHDGQLAEDNEFPLLHNDSIPIWRKTRRRVFYHTDSKLLCLACRN